MPARRAALVLATWGADPVWASWARTGADAGWTLEAWEGARCEAPDAVLTSPWSEPGPESVRRVVAALQGRSPSADVWLVCTSAFAPLNAMVLAAGGAGCLPRLPSAESLERIGRLAAWWPPEGGGAPLAATPGEGGPGAEMFRARGAEPDPDSPPAAAPPVGSGARVGPGTERRAPLVRGVAGVLRGVGGRAAAFLRHQVHGMRSSDGAPEGGGERPGRGAATGAIGRLPFVGTAWTRGGGSAGGCGPRASEGQAGPWWRWPEGGGAGLPTLVVLAARPGGEAAAASALEAWAARRGAGWWPVPGQTPAGAAVPARAPVPVAPTAVYLGCPWSPPPGQPSGEWRRAAAGAAVAVVSRLDAAELGAARHLARLLRVAGAADVRVWLVGPRVTEGALRELSAVLGVGCLCPHP